MSRSTSINSTIVANMKLLCVGTGDHIVSDSQLENQYRLFDHLNILNVSTRNSYITAYTNKHTNNPEVDISIIELKKLFRENGKTMIIVENYASSNATISVIGFDDAIFIDLLPTYNSTSPANHACFVFEKEYFNGKNNMLYPPDSFGSVESITDCRVTMGIDNSSGTEQYCVIINALDGNTLANSLQGGPPPGIGSKFPPKPTR